jgi:hypothetical protein
VFKDPRKENNERTNIQSRRNVSKKERARMRRVEDIIAGNWE